MVERETVSTGQYAISAVMSWLLWADRHDFTQTFGDLGIVLYANWLMDRDAMRFIGHLSSRAQRQLVRSALEKAKGESNDK